jgi:RNA polymerase sigma-70 factor (ECF subfamily)
MQELYLAVLKMQRSQPISHPKAYLFTIAAHLAHQHRRRNKDQSLRMALDDMPATVFGTTHPDLDPTMPESAAVLNERLSQLRQRLGELSPNVQAAILLHHRDGYTCDEVGEKLSVKSHRVKKYLVKGMRHCRAAL